MIIPGRFRNGREIEENGRGIKQPMYSCESREPYTVQIREPTKKTNNRMELPIKYSRIAISSL